MTDNSIVFYWDVIVEMFRHAFQDSCLNKKAYFDCVTSEETSFDGVTQRWCEPLLLDAIVCFYRRSYHSDASKRCFNQHFVFTSLMKSALENMNSCNVESMVVRIDAKMWSTFGNFWDWMKLFKHTRSSSCDKARRIFDHADTRSEGLDLPDLIYRVLQDMIVMSSEIRVADTITASSECNPQQCITARNVLNQSKCSLTSPDCSARKRQKMFFKAQTVQDQDGTESSEHRKSHGDFEDQVKSDRNSPSPYGDQDTSEDSCEGKDRVKQMVNSTSYGVEQLLRQGFTMGDIFSVALLAMEPHDQSVEKAVKVLIGFSETPSNG